MAHIYCVVDDNIFEISQEDSLMADPRQGDFITSVHQILTFSISLNFFVPMQTVISICLTMKMKMQGKYFQFRISICTKYFVHPIFLSFGFWYFGHFSCMIFFPIFLSCPSCLAKCKQRLHIIFVCIFVTLLPKVTSRSYLCT